MSIIKTTEDGWDCVPELKRVTNKLDELDAYIYEIKNCVRCTNLEHMVFTMKSIMEDAIAELEGIDTSVEYETEEDEY